MDLKTRIEGDLKDAMLKKDTAKVTTLRGLKSSILDAEVASGKRADGLRDEEIEKIVAKEIKKRREALDMYEANGRGELAENERDEMKVLEVYLPKQLSEKEINQRIDEVLASLGEGEVANMGKIIGEVKMIVGNGADGATVARLVKEKLS